MGPKEDRHVHATHTYIGSPIFTSRYLRSPWSVVVAYHNPISLPCSPSLCSEAVCMWKQGTRPGSQWELAVGVLGQCPSCSCWTGHLWSPKEQPGNSPIMLTVLHLFPPPSSLQTHNLLCMREPTEFVSVCLLEQLDWYSQMDRQPTSLLRSAGKGREHAGDRELCSCLWRHPSIPRPPPQTACTFCVATGCSGCHHE